MTRPMLLLFALLAGCGRGDVQGSGSDEPDALTRPSLLRISVKRAPRWPEEYPAHFIRLPLEGDVAMTKGEMPSRDHPSGTVYLSATFDSSRHLTISEWDLATGKPLRRKGLPFDIAHGWPRILHEGERIHLVGTSSDGVYYTLLDTSFQVVARTRLRELDRNSAVVASDGTLTIVVGRQPSYDGAPGGADPYAATFDARGRLVAKRDLPLGPGVLGGGTIMGDYAAVIRGTPYLLTEDGAVLRLHELGPDLTEVIRTVIPARGDWDWNRASLSARGDRIVVDAPPQQFECSLDLAELREVPRRPLRIPRVLRDAALEEAGLGELAECSQSIAVGPLYALYCNVHPGDARYAQFIAWDRAER